MTRKLFVNLAVRDLKRSVDFFTKLGFAFDLRFTDENATCMILSEEAFVMLLVKDYFTGFTRKQVCETSTHTEALLAITCPSRSAVDELVNAAIAAGGKHAMEPQDHGFMYVQSFYDPDDHHWEAFWMDPDANPNG